MQVSRSRARTVILTVAATLVIAMMAPVASYAGSHGSRNTAIGLAGVSAYLLMKGKTLPGIAAAAGAGYAYSRSQNDRKAEQTRHSTDWRRAGSYHAPSRYQSRDCYKCDSRHRDARYHDARYHDRYYDHRYDRRGYRR